MITPTYDRVRWSVLPPPPFFFTQSTTARKLWCYFVLPDWAGTLKVLTIKNFWRCSSYQLADLIHWIRNGNSECVHRATSVWSDFMCLVHLYYIVSLLFDNRFWKEWEPLKSLASPVPMKWEIVDCLVPSIWQRLYFAIP